MITEKKNNTVGNKIKHLFERKMYLISLIFFIFIIKFPPYVSTTYGINKTIGWAYDVSGLSNYILYFLICFFIGFSLLALLKAKTNFYLSIIYSILITFCTLFQDKIENILIIDKVLLSCLFVFIIVFLHSIFARIKQYVTNKKNNY